MDFGYGERILTSISTIWIFALFSLGIRHLPWRFLFSGGSRLKFGLSLSIILMQPQAIYLSSIKQHKESIFFYCSWCEPWFCVYSGLAQRYTAEYIVLVIIGVILYLPVALTESNSTLILNMNAFFNIVSAFWFKGQKIATLYFIDSGYSIFQHATLHTKCEFGLIHGNSQS